jgi:hypothetical protein
MHLAGTAVHTHVLTFTCTHACLQTASANFQEWLVFSSRRAQQLCVLLLTAAAAKTLRGGLFIGWPLPHEG